MRGTVEEAIVEQSATTVSLREGKAPAEPSNPVTRCGSAGASPSQLRTAYADAVWTIQHASGDARPAVRGGWLCAQVVGSSLTRPPAGDLSPSLRSGPTAGGRGYGIRIHDERGSPDGLPLFPELRVNPAYWVPASA